MTLDPDPYRTLGLERGASLAEVKRAYRRLAKANHPDAAGEAALPRFLAIQAAYDQIAGPDAGTSRSGGRAPSRRAWEADPDRAGATHRAYGGRARPRPGAAPGPRPRPSPRPGRPDRPPGGVGGERTGGARSDGRPKKATLGSTSYDDVDPAAFDPDWGGASWYGTTSGTYWTLNPKEYADPRKHGPEYQARARRAVPGNRPDEDGPTPPSDPPATPGGIGVDAAETAADRPPPTHTSTSWWQATGGEPTAGGPTAGGPTRGQAPGSDPDARGTQPPSGRAHTVPPIRPQTTTTAATPGTLDGRSGSDDLSVDAAVDALRTWLDDDHPSIPARVGRAFVAWTPVALGIGWGLGELSGCGRFAATCDPSVAPISWAVQLGVLVLLILVSRLARIGFLATLGALAPVFLASVLLFATDPAGTDAARSLLGAMMAVGWVLGLIYGFVRELRRGARPVS